MLAVTAPGRLRLSRRELPYIVSFGVAGLAFVQWFYFLAINRLAIGVALLIEYLALLIEYLAPLLVALWALLLQGDRPAVHLGRARPGTHGAGADRERLRVGTSLSTPGVLFARKRRVRRRGGRAGRDRPRQTAR
jgi:hypothetical protein